jgi:hypothetical protein
MYESYSHSIYTNTAIPDLTKKFFCFCLSLPRSWSWEGGAISPDECIMNKSILMQASNFKVLSHRARPFC